MKRQEVHIPIKHRVAQAREHRITPAALEACRAGDALMLTNATRLVEDDLVFR